MTHPKPTDPLTEETFRAIRDLFGPCSTTYECLEWDDVAAEPGDDGNSQTVAGFIHRSLNVEKILLERGADAIGWGGDDPERHYAVLREGRELLAGIHSRLTAAGYPTR